MCFEISLMSIAFGYETDAPLRPSASLSGGLFFRQHCCSPKHGHDLAREQLRCTQPFHPSEHGDEMRHPERDIVPDARDDLLRRADHHVPPALIAVAERAAFRQTLLQPRGVRLDDDVAEPAALDRRRIAPDGAAVLIEDRNLALELLHRTAEVPAV